MSNNLKIIKISDLPDSRSVETAYFFGYDSDPDKPLNEQSVKIPFSEVAKASTERRIGIVMETDTAIVPIGEAMKITKATGKNVSKLEIKPNTSSIGSWRNVSLNANINIDISDCEPYDALVRITRATTDNVSTVYLFTKVTN